MTISTRYITWFRCHWFLITMLCNTALVAQSEICQGSFGDNIFDNGDFGTGSEVILQNDPGIAPGFQYSTQVPFEDGFYTLTNNMADWPQNWPTWLGIEDNSDDPDGYMMVVNASFAPGIFYEQSINDLCASAIYEISFDVINVVKSTVSGHILPDVSLLVNGQTVLTTGPIPQDESWHTFKFNLGNVSEEVTITFRNNAPGGIGNDLALDNITLRLCGPVATTTIDNDGRICENALFPTMTAVVDVTSDSAAFQWEFSENFGMTWSDIPGADSTQHQVAQLTPGVYQFRFRWAAHKTDINSDFCIVHSLARTVIVVPILFEITDTLCEGLNFDIAGELFDQTGVYERQLVSSIGCDSIIILDLTIVADPMMEIVAGTNAPLCAGERNGEIWLAATPSGAPPFFVNAGQDLQWTYPDTVTVAAGTYDLKVTDRHGCTGQTTADLVDPPPFTIGGLRDTAVTLGQVILLHPIFNASIDRVEWQGEGLSCISCPDSEAKPLRDELYTIMAVSVNGCEAEASLKVSVDQNGGYYIPNIFTPNSDGVNDLWGIHTDPSMVDNIHRVIIADRWGGIVLDQSLIGVTRGIGLWDGRTSGQNAPSGVYTFVAEIRLINDATVVASGTITLLR